MSKLLKSKFLLGTLAIFAAFALTVTTVAAADAITMTLRQGMSNSQVMTLQQTLNAKGYTVSATGAGSVGSETNYFGSRTTAAVKSFQSASGLAVDGIFGPMSRAALNASTTTGGTTTLPAGCTSTVGYSPTTGTKCDSGTTTGTTTLPAGCTSTAGFSPTTGQACSGTGTVVTTGPLSASLAFTTPASGTLVADQALADLAHFAFTGTGTINSVTLMRTGISADSTLEDVFLFDGAVRLTDSATVSSGSLVTFTGLNIAVNGSRTLSVRADIAGSTSGQTVGIQLVSFNGGAAALTGNLHTIASATLAGVAVASATGSVTEPGADLQVWGGTLTVSTRDVTLNRLALRQVGSIPANEINNFKLLVDGVQVATAASLDANNYVTFDVAPVKTLTTGSRVLKVMADVVGGSNRTLEFDLRGSYDVSVTDTQFNKGVESTGTFPFGPSSSTLSAGSLSIVKATGSASGNITNAANDASYGTFTFTAYGEAVKVETLTVAFDWSGTDANATVRNVRIMANGSQVGSTTSVPAADAHASGTSFTTNFMVNPGTPVTVDIRGDVYDNEGTQEFAASDTLQVGLVAGSSNAVRQSSLGSFNAPSALTTGNVLTVKVGTLSLAQTSNYPAQSTISPQTAYKIASYVLTGNSTEAVTVNTFDLDVAVVDNGAGSPDVTDVTDVYIKYGSNQTSIKSTVVATGNTWSPSFSLGVNETMTVEVYGTLSSDLKATDTVTASLEVTSQTAQSATSVGTGVVAGQTITMATASITASIDASSPVATLLDDSGSVVTAAYKFVTVTDAYTITDVNVTLATASTISTVHLMDGTTVLASKPAATDLTFSGLSIPVNANSTKVLSIKVDLSGVGPFMGTSASSLLTTLDVSDTLARNSQGTSAAVAGSDPASTTSYVYKAVPTLSVLPLPSTVLAAGTQTLAKFSVNTNGTGTVAWDRISFDIVKTSAPTVASLTVWNADTNTQVAGTATIHDTADAASCLATLLGCKATFTPTSEEQVSGTRNYVLKATIAGTLIATDYITTSIPQNVNSFAASNTAATVIAVGITGSLDTYAEYALINSFVWSDMSAASHSTTTSDWSGDFLVKSLPLDSQTLN